jgi:hypothetical protein
MLEHFQGFSLAGNASKGAFDMRIELKGLNQGSGARLECQKRGCGGKIRYLRAARHQ